MKPQHDFIAARPAAQHCEELLARAAGPIDTGKVAEQLAGRICDALPGELQPLLGKQLRVSAGPATRKTATALFQQIGKPKASYRIALRGGGMSCLVSIDLGAAISLTDRLFGGSGTSPDDAPEALPLSASLAVERIVAAIAMSAIGDRQLVRDCDIHHHADAARLAAFPRRDQCMAWHFTVLQGDHAPWDFCFALLESTLDALVSDATRQGRTTPSFSAAASSAPFRDLPLPLTATVAEMRLPLARLYALKAGDILPFPIQRDVPLRLGQTVIAHGSIGAMDERIALQINQTF